MGNEAPSKQTSGISGSLIGHHRSKPRAYVLLQRVSWLTQVGEGKGGCSEEGGSRKATVPSTRLTSMTHKLPVTNCGTKPLFSSHSVLVY